MANDNLQKVQEHSLALLAKKSIQRIGWTKSPEQEQGALRITISIAFLCYMLQHSPSSANGIHAWNAGMPIIIGFLIYSILLFSATLLWPQHYIHQRIIGICIDIGIFSYGLHMTGPLSAPWYGVYLWVTLGNGFRYGEKYLYLSSATSLIGFSCVVLFTEYWASNMKLAIGLAATLLVIPAYSAILIRRLNEALERADSASRAKSEFLSCMSHEIRTPLNGILGMTDLLRTRPLERDDRESVNIIHASGQTLARQIDEILDLSKIEAGQLTLEHIEFDLYVMINTTLRVFQPQVEAKGIQLQENLDPSTPYLLYGDPHKLRQIIINLIGNAIKFTNKGFVSLRVYPRDISEGQAKLRFEVADTGIGISPDRIEAIFEPFTQANSGVTRNYGGTGLGTTICKNLVELMDGEIGIHSTPDVGTTFWFDIPFTMSEKDAAISGDSWAKYCRVLYIPPFTDTHTATEASLKKWNIPFETIASVDEAYPLIQENASQPTPYNALVIDEPDDVTSLNQLLSDLKRENHLGTISVILVHIEPKLAWDHSETHDQIFTLQSPVDQRILYNTLHAAYSRHSSEEDIVHIAQQQIRNQHSTKPLKILIGDDNATNRIVLERMLEKLGHRCTVVTGGEEILHELEDHEFDTVIADKNMPDLGGIETYQAYCLAQGGYPEIKFIILTADATEESRNQCKDAGIDLFLTKPVSLARLQETLAKIKASTLDNTDMPLPAEEEQSSGMEALPVVDDTEFDNLIVLSENNQNFIREIISNFETDVYEDIRGMEASVAKHDWHSFKDYAHALKGSALYLGLGQLAHLSLLSQNIKQEEFEQKGIASILTIRKAADDAIRSLKEKERTLRKTG